VPSYHRPPIVLCESDAERLSALAHSAPDAAGLAADFLLEEIERARVIPDRSIAANVVRMDSEVEFADETSGARRTVRLVLPEAADISAGAISVLTPVGAGLIGLRPGQSINWPDRTGRERRLRILGVRN
jgi:regulator of nucleoside diphosphate kinase